MGADLVNMATCNGGCHCGTEDEMNEVVVSGAKLDTERSLT